MTKAKKTQPVVEETKVKMASAVGAQIDEAREILLAFVDRAKDGQISPKVKTNKSGQPYFRLTPKGLITLSDGRRVMMSLAANIVDGSGTGGDTETLISI